MQLCVCVWGDIWLDPFTSTPFTIFLRTFLFLQIMFTSTASIHYLTYCITFCYLNFSSNVFEDRISSMQLCLPFPHSFFCRICPVNQYLCILGSFDRIHSSQHTILMPTSFLLVFVCLKNLTTY